MKDFIIGISKIDFYINRRNRLVDPFIYHKPSKRKHLEIMEDVKNKKQNKKQFQCQECDLAFYHRKGLNIHRKVHESVKDQTFKEQACDGYGATFFHGTDVTERKLSSTEEEVKQLAEKQMDSKLDNVLIRYSTRENKKGRKVFISDQRFDQLAENKQLVKWIELSHDCIYKMELLYRHDEHQIVADLSDRDGAYQSVILPISVIEKLLELEQSVTVYLKPIGNDGQVSIVAVKKYVCTDCNMDFSTAATLGRHRKKHCK